MNAIRCRNFVLLLAGWLLAIPAPGAMAQTFPSHKVKIGVDSGDLFHDGEKPQVIWSEEIRAPRAEWIRLQFSRLVLAHDPVANTSSTLRVVSLRDGAEQLLNEKSARQWRNTSAYFNGDAVRVELIAWPNGRLNRVSIRSATAGDPPTIPPARTICDVLDDRTLSSDPRVGRTVPGGCTAWLFNDQQHCMLTAGHCAASTDVIEFNVPLSSSSGAYNHPGPEDQYPVDPASMQFVNGGVGNDWCYFGCFENSNTGLTAFEAQGSSFPLALPQPVSGGDVIRITGHGTTSAPVDPSWNGAQKTHTGPHSVFTGSELGYRTDTTGGNSGSPVIYENDGTAIGIHTHGGCSSGGSGSNAGTGANNSGLQQALANPLGICRATLDFEFPNGRPETLDPSGGTTIRVLVTDGGEIPQPGSGLLHYDDGSGFQSVPMTGISPNLYDAVFPATACGAVVRYYVSAENDSAQVFTSPADAPASVYTALSAHDTTTVFLDDFQSSLGWSVSGNAGDGQWQRGVPAGGGDRGDPPADGDGSGSCYVTDNVDGNSDVDDGSTILTSPTIDASVAAGQEAVIAYYRWYSNSTGSAPQEDTFVVEISNNNGSSWTNLETVGPGGSEVNGGWIMKQFRISDFVTPTSQMRVRFTASDLGDGSIVEAGVDGVEILVVDCGSPVTAPAIGKTADGVVSGGQLSDVFESDDSYLAIDPEPTSNPFKQKIEYIVQQISPTASPTEFRFRLEAKMLGGPSGDVMQSMELWNYNTSSFEVVDLSPMEVSDTVVEYTATGDLTRFVNQSTSEITAMVTFNSFSWVGTPFFWDVEVDQIVWLIQ